MNILSKTVLLLILFLIFFPARVSAANLQCDNRYVTLVNPVRGRNLWSDQSLKPIQDQYQIINDHNFAATWLLQYDTLRDRDLLTTIKGFDTRQEKGVFLEVSANLAEDARVLYPQQTPWFKPNAVFLSGYSQSERRKLIDQLFGDFRHVWGYYPKSVGAWWIDSYSLQYMQQKYGITSAMIVADQLSTDNYGVWGQWWGVPFYPAKANILEPSSNISNKLAVAVIQWAQRDPLRAYGDSKSYSNYSLQANDYISQGLTTDYFKEISSVYLDCSHPIGQITVGLETGQESIPYISEYQNQLDYLKSVPNLKLTTMFEFASHAHGLPETENVRYQGSNWKLTTHSRENVFLKDQISYDQNLSFSDYFIKDQTGFLNRKLPIQNKAVSYFPFWLLVGIVGIFYFKRRNNFWVGVVGFLFAISSYGLILKAFYQYGWQVYFGPIVEWLSLVQIGLVLVGFGVAWGWSKILEKFKVKSLGELFLIATVFGLDLIIEFLRYTKLSGETYLGILIDPFHFVGLVWGKNIHFVNQDFSAQIASALLKFDFQNIWAQTWNWLVLYPLTHLVLAGVLLLVLMKIPKKLRIIILGGLGLLWLGFLFNLLGQDPVWVQPITRSGLPGLIQ